MRYPSADGQLPPYGSQFKAVPHGGTAVQGASRIIMDSGGPKGPGICAQGKPYAGVTTEVIVVPLGGP